MVGNNNNRPRVLCNAKFASLMNEIGNICKVLESEGNCEFGDE